MNVLDTGDRWLARALRAVAALLLTGSAALAAAMLARGVHGLVETDLRALLPATRATLSCAVVATALGAVPGMAVAVYTAELSEGPWRERAVRVLEVCAALPGVVFGFAALRLLGLLGVERGSTLVTGVVLAVMILPTVALLSVEALRSAPEALREASEALGASAWQTTWRVVVPSRWRGLAAAGGAGFARAAGETVAVQLLASRGGGPRTLTARIIDELPRAPPSSAWNHSLFAMSLMLLILSTGVALLARPPARSSPSDEPSSLR
ncbi:MAG: ABC transporter permease subunit [Deltaproteobacteria bacterium]|nr:ABC transporter permease subunit [Deltaproteobacteria bacterium]